MSVEALGLEPGCGPTAVKARWRELAALHHPDRGGDDGEFSRLRQAYVSAMAAEAVCPECRGLGKTVVSQGFHSVKLVCTGCGGTGKALS